MATIKQTIMFGTDLIDDEKHTHESYLSDLNNVVIKPINYDENDLNDNFIVISIEEWTQLRDFIDKEIQSKK